MTRKENKTSDPIIHPIILQHNRAPKIKTKPPELVPRKEKESISTPFCIEKNVIMYQTKPTHLRPKLLTDTQSRQSNNPTHPEETHREYGVTYSLVLPLLTHRVN